MKRPVFAADFWNKAIEQNLIGIRLTEKSVGDWNIVLFIMSRYRTDLTFTDDKDDLITLIYGNDGFYGDDDDVEIYFGDQRSNHIGHMVTKEQLLNFVANRSGSVELQNFFLFNQLL